MRSFVAFYLLRVCARTFSTCVVSSGRVLFFFFFSWKETRPYAARRLPVTSHQDPAVVCHHPQGGREAQADCEERERENGVVGRKMEGQGGCGREMPRQREMTAEGEECRCCARRKSQSVTIERGFLVRNSKLMIILVSLEIKIVVMSPVHSVDLQSIHNRSIFIPQPITIEWLKCFPIHVLYRYLRGCVLTVYARRRPQSLRVKP